MKKIIRLVGKHNDLDLGYVENGTYYETGLLDDSDHSWKILEWINQEIENGWQVKVVTRLEP